MKLIAILLSTAALAGCSGFLKPDYRIETSIIGQQYAVEDVKVVIKEANKVTIYDHCIRLDGACYGQPYEEMQRELHTELMHVLGKQRPGAKKSFKLTAEVIELQVQSGMRRRAKATVAYRLHDVQSGREKFRSEISSEGSALQVGFHQREGVAQNEALNRAVQNNLDILVEQLQQARVLSF